MANVIIIVILLFAVFSELCFQPNICCYFQNDSAMFLERLTVKDITSPCMYKDVLKVNIETFQ